MFEADASAGIQNVSNEDMALPFLKIVSGLDGILDERDDVRKGDIVNTVTGEVYKGKDGIKVIPCAYQRKFIRWQPRGTGIAAPVMIHEPNDPNLPKTNRDPMTIKNMSMTGQVIMSSRQLSGMSKY